MSRPAAIGKRVIVEIIERKQQTDSGILLPDTGEQQFRAGLVVAAGRRIIGRTGVEDIIRLSAGDTVYFSKFAGTEFEHAGRKYTSLDESDILGVA